MASGNVPDRPRSPRSNSDTTPPGWHTTPYLWEMIIHHAYFQILFLLSPSLIFLKPPLTDPTHHEPPQGSGSEAEFQVESDMGSPSWDLMVISNAADEVLLLPDNVSEIVLKLQVQRYMTHWLPCSQSPMHLSCMPHNCMRAGVNNK